jgi:hypothetical protein
VVEPADSGNDQHAFDAQLAQTLAETEAAVLGVTGEALSPLEAESWVRARSIVADFRPVPWFIWRICNFVLGKSGQSNPVSEGLVLGLRRLLFAAASDPALGSGEKVNTVKRAIQVLSPDVIAAVSVIHAVNRRLATHQFERIWRPILDDAILRARIGLDVGDLCPEFGAGRGMLAGFAGRCGLGVLIGSGDLDRARRALEMLASGTDIKLVGLSVYQVDPLQVSAMILTASGCSRDASFGTVGYSLERGDGGKSIVQNDDQMRWLSAFGVIEGIRTGNAASVRPEHWEMMGIPDAKTQGEVVNELKRLLRRGHGWSWIL